MWKKLIFLCAFSAVITCGCSAEQPVSTQSGNVQGDHVAVYYFHGDTRCVSCKRIQEYTKEALDVYFKEETASGKLVFNPVNVDRKENRHFVQDYQLFTKSVIVSLVKGGTEVKYENLQDVWKYLRDKDRFLNYIKSEVGEYLEELD